MCLVRPALLYLNVHVLKVFHEQINYYHYYYYYYLHINVADLTSILIFVVLSVWFSVSQNIAFVFVLRKLRKQFRHLGPECVSLCSNCHK